MPGQQDMSLKEMLEGIQYEVVQGSDTVNVSSLCYDTRDMWSKSVFVCIKGSLTDAHTLAQEAVYKGAVAIVAEEYVSVTADITVIRVGSTRKALAYMSANYWEHPSRDMLMIGITGTKGKTTTAYMIDAILSAAGFCTGIIGSIEVRYGNISYNNDNTTPESYRLHEIMYNMKQNGVNVVIMEVSSQALKLERVAGIMYDYAVYTNISRDHIGQAEHRDMKEYIHFKSLLFSQCRNAVLNIDDGHVDDMISECKDGEIIYYGKGRGDVCADKILAAEVNGMPGVRYTLSCAYDEEEGEGRVIALKLPGEYSVYNSLAAIAACNHIMGGDEPDTRYELMKCVLEDFSVKGRMEVFKSEKGYMAIVDYAHNELSLQSLLQSLRPYVKGLLICIFGCGGGRSVLRRYNMGEVSARFADVTIITDDNPRYEPSEKIISDIETGILRVLDGGSRTDFTHEYRKETYLVEEDREKAIQNALSKAGKDDMIVIAGKGHENYQEIRGVRYPSNDSEIVKNILQWRI